MTGEGRDGADESVALERLTGVLFRDEGLPEILEQVVCATHDLLAPVIAASVTLTGPHEYRTAAYSAPLAKLVDEVQYETGRGPCLEAIRTGEPVELPDVAADPRWPAVAAAASAEGASSMLAIPLMAGSAGVVGALNLYGGEPDGFREIRSGIEHFTENVAVVLANAQAYTEAMTMADGLKQALLTRELIGIAKGILMERHRIGEEAAFDALRERSQRENVKLREVAAAVIQEASGDGPGA